MPNRIIKESICTSENIDSLSTFEENVFYRLIVNCDDYGRADARPKLLSSRLYPLKDISAEQITDALDALVRANLIILYEVDGKPYLQMTTWEKHQRIRNSVGKYPAPETNTPATSCGELPRVAASCGEQPRVAARARAESESESESESINNVNTHARTVETPFGDVVVDALIVKVQKELTGLTDTHYDLLGQYRNALGDELVSLAIDKAVANGVRKWAYVERILHTWEEKGIKTVGEAKAEDERHRKTSGPGNKQVTAQQFTQRTYTDDELEMETSPLLAEALAKVMSG